MDKIKKLRDDIINIRKTVHKTRGATARGLRLYVLGALDKLDLTCLDDRYISRSDMVRRPRVAMDKLKDSGQIFTGSVFGWDNVEDGTVVPNWDEQDTITYMQYLWADNRTGAYIAKKMNDANITGKRGGKWTSASVLRVIRNEYHSNRNKYPKPDWWGEEHYHN